MAIKNFGTLYKEGIQRFISKVKENKSKAIFVLGFYVIAITAIGLVNFPYIDDVGRQLQGQTFFGWHYGRWGSEYLSWLVQGSQHLTDMGLVTHFLTAIVLTISSLLLLYVLESDFKWLPTISSIFLGLNPWFLQCVSFRFDSPYMAMSILFSLIPFLWWKVNKNLFYFMSIISIFLMCNTYQLSSGIFIVVFLGLLLLDFTQNGKFWQLLKISILTAVSYALGIIIFEIETKIFNPAMTDRGATVELAKLDNIFSAIVNNVIVYFDTVISETSTIVYWLSVILIFLFFIVMIIRSQANKVATTIFMTVYLVLTFVLSYGVLLIFANPLATYSLRYEYGLPSALTVLIILLSSNMKKDFKITNILTKIALSLFLYYSLSFPFIYASNLSYQKDSFENQSIILTTDLKDVVNDNRKTVYMNTLFKESQVLSNSEKNYPILPKLIPSNANLYWPNLMLFNTYSNLNVEIVPYNFNNFVKEGYTLEKQSQLYDIYTSETEIYVFMK